MMPKMTDFRRKVMFCLSLFLSFLVFPTGGSSSLVAVAGCDGRSDKKELQASISMDFIQPTSAPSPFEHVKTLKNRSKEWGGQEFKLTLFLWLEFDIDIDIDIEFDIDIYIEFDIDIDIYIDIDIDIANVRTWPQHSCTPTGVCWRTSRWQCPSLSTPSQTWSSPHISLSQGAQVGVQQQDVDVIAVIELIFVTPQELGNLFIAEQSSNW